MSKKCMVTPNFLFWFPIALAKICFSCIVINHTKILRYLVYSILNVLCLITLTITIKIYCRVSNKVRFFIYNIYTTLTILRKENRKYTYLQLCTLFKIPYIKDCVSTLDINLGLPRVKTCEVFLCFGHYCVRSIFCFDFFVFFVLRHSWRWQVFTPRMSHKFGDCCAGLPFTLIFFFSLQICIKFHFSRLVVIVIIRLVCKQL